MARLHARNWSPRRSSQAGPGGKAERYVPRAYWLAAAARILLPALVRRATSGGGFTTATCRQSD